MKAQILKIAGVKTDKEFYKLFPSEEAFMKVHGKAFKKAQMGTYIGGDTMSNAEPISYQTYYDDADKLITGTTEKERQEAAYKEEELKANKASSSGMESLLGMISGGAPGGGEEEGAMPDMDMGRNGKYIPKAQTGFVEGIGMDSMNGYNVDNSGNVIDGSSTTGYNATSNGGAGFVNNALKAVPVVGGLVSGIQALGAEKEAAKAAKQQRTVSGLQLTASATRPEQIQRRYVRPEDVAIQPNQMFPTYGVGTNVLARDGIRLQGGGEIQNTYAPDYLYDDLGYEPLNDSNIKQYYRGGGIPKAAGGFSNYMNSLSGGGSGFSGAGEAGSTPWAAIGSTAAGMAGETNAGGNIGGTVGGALGSAFGPAGNAVGTFVGTIAGNALDPYAKAIKRDTAATKRNIENIAYNKMAPGLIAPYQAHARNGGDIPAYQDGGQSKYDVKNSIVDLLKSKNRDSDYSSRKELATKLGIKNYKGTANQNIYMMHLIDKEDSTPLKQSTKSTTVPVNNTLKGKPDVGYTPINKQERYDGAPKSKPIEKSKKSNTPSQPTKSVPVNKSIIGRPSSVYAPVDKQEKYDKPTKKSNTSTPQLTPIKKSAINKPKPITSKPKETTKPVINKPVDVKHKVVNNPKVNISTEARKLQSGVITDKGTNTTHVVENGKIVKSFPVLTGIAKNRNTNEYSVEYLEKNPSKRATPTGTYLMNPNSDIYGAPGFNLQPIPAFGQAAPKSTNTAIHTIYGTNPNQGEEGYHPKEGKRRTYALNSSNPNNRYMSFGCTNARCDDVKDLAKRFPVKDTAVYIDSRIAKDKNYLKSIKRNEFGGNTPNYEEGGWVSHDWQPQVIASFGGLNEQEVYDYAHDGMQSLRAGGHVRGEYTPISNRGMEQYAMGGEVKTTWGGHAETISHNPYMPGTGETIMFRGKSHDESDGNGNTGIGVKYGKGAKDSYTDYAEYGAEVADADVEVERGEPAAELQDANGEKNLTVYGNLKIPNQYIDLLGDPNAKGKKFKNYVNDLSKIEAKQNKIVESSITKLNALNPQTQFDKLKLTSLQASIEGANMKLKDIASKKTNAAYLQNAINDTAEENGLVADDLARGKVKFDTEAPEEYARYGTSIPKAKNGDKIKPGSMTVKEAIKQGYVLEADGKYHLRTKATAKPATQTKNASALDAIPKGQRVDKKTGLYGGITPEQFEAYKEKNKWYDWTGFDPKDESDLNDYRKKFNAKAEAIGSKARILEDKGGKPKFGQQYYSAKLDEAKQEEPVADTDKIADIYDPEDNVYPVEAQKRNPWLDLAGQVLPFFRPTDQEGLDYDQLMGEMYALSNNQVEPVQAQSYQPDLATPYDISYQDQLNANQADYNSMQKMVGYNPAAQSVLNAQKYAANTGVLGEQFRANQAMKMGVYDQNRQTLNNAKLKNLDIFDRQYTRQEQAKSNTKAVTQAALNSISDKYAKNKLENRELGIYENLYNYRYDAQGRAINMNAPWQANVPNVYNKGNETANMRAVYDQQGNFLRYEPIEQTKTTTEETTTAIPSGSTGPMVASKKYGGSIKTKNGSIVSAYKNL